MEPFLYPLNNFLRPDACNFYFLNVFINVCPYVILVYNETIAKFAV